MVAAIVGALAVLVPSLIAGAFLVQQKTSLKEQLTMEQRARQEEKTQWVFCLKKNKNAGEELTEDDLEAKEITIADNTDFNCPDKTKLVGKRLKCNLSKGSMVLTDVLYEGARISDDQRSLKLKEIELPENMEKGDFFDVRISFPDGEDFVVLSRKNAEGVNKDEDGNVTGVSIELGEEEILLLASAYVDQTDISGTKIYAMTYLEETQNASLVNYPVRSSVEELSRNDPNVSTKLIKDTNETRRKLLESNLEFSESSEDAEQEETTSREELLNLFD